MSEVGKGPSTVVAQARAWQTVLTIITSPGRLWVWIAVPQKLPDHLPWFIALPHQRCHILRQNLISPSR